MKKFLLSLAILGAAGNLAYAQETIETLFTGNQTVTWANTLYFEASKFDNVTVGDYIYITFSNTTDVIELKSDGVWLPGSRFSYLGEGVQDYKCYITADGLAALQTTGLELCGASFTVSSVSIMNDGFVMPEGAVWGGYFWIDNWNTLEIWETAFAKYNGEKFMVINISDDNGDNTNYVMQVMTKFDDPAAVIGNNDKGNETKTGKMTVIDLTGINLSSMLENADRILVQGNPEGGNAFNITSVVLTNNNPLSQDNPSGINEISTISETVAVYTMRGTLIMDNVDPYSAIANLSKGIYILKGKNGIKKIIK